MRNVLNIIINDCRRTVSNRFTVLTSMGITFLLILLAIFFTSRFEIKGNIAVIAHGNLPDMRSKYLNVTLLEAPPPTSQLVMNRYDAVVVYGDKGEFKIETIKSKTFRDMLENMLKNPGATVMTDMQGNGNRGAGVNILGYLIMFLMLQGLFFMNYFTEDKERRNLRRIAASPVPMGGYLAGHFIFNLVMIFAPTMAVLIIGKEALKVDIGLTYGQYSFLLLLLSILSAAFALLMTALVEKSDNVMSAASTIILVTSMLSGSFGAVNTGNDTVNRLFDLLPQKNYLTLVQGLENGRPATDFPAQLGFLLLLAALMIGLGTAVCRKRFNEGRY